MKRGLKILTTILITFCIIALANNVLAIDMEFYKPGDLNIKDNSPYYTIAGTVISTIRVIAAIVCVAVIVIVGIKIIYGSVEEKAEYKKRFVPIIIGAVFVVGTTTMLKALEYNINYDQHKTIERQEAEKKVDDYLDITLSNIDFTQLENDENYLGKLANEIESFVNFKKEQGDLNKEQIDRLKNMASTLSTMGNQYYKNGRDGKMYRGNLWVDFKPEEYGLQCLIITKLANGEGDIKTIFNKQTEFLCDETLEMDDAQKGDTKIYPANLYSSEKIENLIFLIEEYLVIENYIGYYEGDGFKRAHDLGDTGFNLRTEREKYEKILRLLRKEDLIQGKDDEKGIFEYYSNKDKTKLKEIETKCAELKSQKWSEEEDINNFMTKHYLAYETLAKNMVENLEKEGV